MHPPEASASLVRSELEKILASPAFAHNDRQSKFLRFVVEQQLEGQASQLKESLVGIEVFGRRPDYDPRQDSVVRTEAAKLRARLSRYYAGDGAPDPLVIELPKGGYTPVFREPEARVWSRPGTRLWLTITLAALALIPASGWRWMYHKTAPIPIAVLPLNSLSEGAANDYFADGLTSEIIRNLSIIDGLAVRSQTSSFAFKGKPRNIRDAGKQLAVDYVLEGSVRSAGRHLRINAQLVRVRDDLPVWSGGFDRELTDVLAIQDDISRGIVNSLRLKLGRGRRRYETSMEAYDLYLRGRALQAQLGATGIIESVGPFEQAIAKDPSFAPAQAGLASAYAFRSADDRFDRTDEMSKMQATAEKAIQLDPLLAEAHEAEGMIQARDAQWEQAEKSFRRSIEIDPGRSEARGYFAFFLLLPLGRVEEALRQLRLAEKADPLSGTVQNILAYVLTSAGRFDEAAVHCRKVPAEFPMKPVCLPRALLGQGRTSEALKILKAAFDGRPSTPWAGELGYAYALIGRSEDAEKLATVAPRPLDQALTFAGLGDKDRTLEALHRVAPQGPFRIGQVLTFPELVLLRRDPRMKALRKEVGLPE